MTTRTLTGPPPRADAAPCKRCGGTRLSTSWQNFRDGTRHLRACCSGCGKFQRFLPQDQGHPEPPDARQTGADLRGLLLGQLDLATRHLDGLAQAVLERDRLPTRLLGEALGEVADVNERLAALAGRMKVV